MVACITITYNDDYKLREWKQWYDEYRDDFYCHIIVDNGSSEEYLTRITELFSSSIIIRRETNGGCTGAYNDGIRKALQDPCIDAIMLLGNDIRLEPGYVKALYNFLYSDISYGMVGGVVYKKDSKVIESYGVTINRIGLPIINYRNAKIDDIPDSLAVSFVGGGVNMAKRAFYETVGLQDENLFMYNDEIDMFYRSSKLNWKEAVTKTAVSWHQHISYPSSNDLAAKMAFLNGRNRVYIIKKHQGARGVLMFLYMFLLETLFFIRDIFKAKSRKAYFSKIRGFAAGIRGDMDNSFLQQGQS